MSKPIIKIHNQETNELIEREMTQEEYVSYQIVWQEEEERKTKQTQKNTQRKEVLEKLGLTEEEIAVL
jgi:hypothetical protein